MTDDDAPRYPIPLRVAGAVAATYGFGIAALCALLALALLGQRGEPPGNVAIALLLGIVPAWLAIAGLQLARAQAKRDPKDVTALAVVFALALLWPTAIALRQSLLAMMSLYGGLAVSFAAIAVVMIAYRPAWKRWRQVGGQW